MVNAELQQKVQELSQQVEDCSMLRQQLDAAHAQLVFLQQQLDAAHAQQVAVQQQLDAAHAQQAPVLQQMATAHARQASMQEQLDAAQAICAATSADFHQAVAADMGIKDFDLIVPTKELLLGAAAELSAADAAKLAAVKQQLMAQDEEGQLQALVGLLAYPPEYDDPRIMYHSLTASMSRRLVHLAGSSTGSLQLQCVNVIRMLVLCSDCNAQAFGSICGMLPLLTNPMGNHKSHSHELQVAAAVVACRVATHEMARADLAASPDVLTQMVKLLAGPNGDLNELFRGVHNIAAGGAAHQVMLAEAPGLVDVVLAYMDTNSLASKALFGMMCGNPRSQAVVADRRQLSVELRDAAAASSSTAAPVGAASSPSAGSADAVHAASPAGVPAAEQSLEVSLEEKEAAAAAAAEKRRIVELMFTSVDTHQQMQVSNSGVPAELWLLGGGVCSRSFPAGCVHGVTYGLTSRLLSACSLSLS